MGKLYEKQRFSREIFFLFRSKLNVFWHGKVPDYKSYIGGQFLNGHLQYQLIN